MRSTPCTAVLAAGLSLLASFGASGAARPARIEHVLLISIDGLHQEDLAGCIAAGTCPHLAALARHGITYTDTPSTRPSDSFPGMIAQVTGGTPRVTGVYYDDSFDGAPLTPALETLGPADRFHVADDILREWLTPAFRARVPAVIGSLIAQQAAGTALGIGKFYAGSELDALFGNPATDPRAPDFILSPRLGVIYANHPGKIAEHGGFHQDDRHVALLVSNPMLRARSFIGAVRTTQIAPTILKALGLDPRALKAVRLEGTGALPKLSGLTSR